jgi:hypothetical protein
MRNILSLILAIALMFGGPQAIVWAETRTFTVSASVPTATSVSITATRVNVANNARTPVTGTTLSFDPMTFNTANQIWLPDHYFIIDVGTTGGAGNTDATFTYTEGANPNSPGHGLGWKSTATFAKVTSSGQETGLTAHGPKRMLKDLNGEHILPAELTDGFLRVYLGIVTKDPSATVPDPASSELFTNADRPGTYDGSLVVTATVT